MTQEEILKYNKLCADVMGWKNLNDDSYPEYLTPMGDFYSLKNLMFDSDWNWIMMVIEKIEGLGFNTDSYSPIHGSVESEATLHEFNIWDKINPEIQGRGKTRKQATVQAIYKFLIWYNENKTTLK